MTHLRSPVVHHIDLEPWALENFAIELDRQEPDAFAPPYQRPSLALFNEHCDRVIETYGLAALHIRGRAEACVVRCEGVSVSLDDGEHIEADRVVLAIGAVLAAAPSATPVADAARGGDVDAVRALLGERSGTPGEARIAASIEGFRPLTRVEMYTLDDSDLGSLQAGYVDGTLAVRRGNVLWLYPEVQAPALFQLPSPDQLEPEPEREPSDASDSDTGDNK